MTDELRELLAELHIRAEDMTLIEYNIHRRAAGAIERLSVERDRLQAENDGWQTEGRKYAAAFEEMAAELAAAVARADKAEAEVQRMRESAGRLSLLWLNYCNRLVSERREATTRVAALLSENTRLRDALREIASSEVSGYTEPASKTIARAALATPAEPEVETRPDLRTEATWRLL